MNLENVTRDDWIVAGIALLLIIDLMFLPWFSVSASVGAITFSASSTATGAPDSLLGILAVLAALLLIVDLAVERLSPETRVPAVAGSRPTTRLVLAGAAAFFLALKFLFHIHFSDFGFGFYAAVVLTVALVYFSLKARQAGTYMGTRAAGSPEPPAV
jgi:hypothetical protein